MPARYEPPPHVLPETWLLAEGWKRAKPISDEVPGPPAVPRARAAS